MLFAKIIKVIRGVIFQCCRLMGENLTVNE